MSRPRNWYEMSYEQQREWEQNERKHQAEVREAEDAAEDARRQAERDRRDAEMRKRQLAAERDEYAEENASLAEEINDLKRELKQVRDKLALYEQGEEIWHVVTPNTTITYLDPPIFVDDEKDTIVYCSSRISLEDFETLKQWRTNG